MRKFSKVRSKKYLLSFLFLLGIVASAISYRNNLQTKNIAASSHEQSKYQGKNNKNEILSIEAEVDVDRLDVDLGEIFSVDSKDSRYHCEARFIKSVSSRQSTNNNEIEFYCRDLEQAIHLDFSKTIKKFNAESSKSDIALYKGMLVDLTQKSFVDVNGEMSSLRSLSEFNNGSVRFFARMKNGTYIKFTDGYELDGEVCPHISLVDENNVYYGSVAFDSYAGLFNDELYLNNSGGLYRSAQLVPFSSCEMLLAKKINQNGDWVYGGFPYLNSYFIGGSNPPAPLYQISENDLTHETKNLEEYGPNISEYYSYLVHQDKLLIGTYPSGNVAIVDSDGSLQLDQKLFPARKSDYTTVNSETLSVNSSNEIVPNPAIKQTKYVHYRELQSLASSYGFLFGGMYPWGEVIAIDELRNTRSTSRVFSHPERTAQKTPYIKEAQIQLDNFWKGSFDSNSELASMRLSRMSATEEELPREYGLFPDAWGQRVSQIVVTNGQICVSTGSMGDSRFIPAVHTHLTREKFDEYGRVLCTDLDRQVLANVPRAGKLKLNFQLNPDSLSIIVNGIEVRNKSSNNVAILNAFNVGGSLEIKKSLLDLTSGKKISIAANFPMKKEGQTEN
jgi:hypothetical protein